MSVENQAAQQLLVFGQSILLGLSAGLLYDLLRPFRVRAPRATGWLDGAYCLAVGGAMFLFLLRRGAGQLRGFVILGGGGGRGAVFLRLFRAAAAPVGVLGGYAGVFVEPALPASAVDKKFL